MPLAPVDFCRRLARRLMAAQWQPARGSLHSADRRVAAERPGSRGFLSTSGGAASDGGALADRPRFAPLGRSARGGGASSVRGFLSASGVPGSMAVR